MLYATELQYTRSLINAVAKYNYLFYPGKFFSYFYNFRLIFFPVFAAR
jgi:hypothetical protein